MIDHDRVVDDEIDRDQRIDLVGIAAERHHRIAHGGEIDDGRHAGEVLHQHARRAEGDLVLVPAAIFDPCGDRLDVLFGDAASVLVTQQIFQHDLQRIRKSGNARRARFSPPFSGNKSHKSCPDVQRFAALETVEAGHASAPGRVIGGRRLIDISSRAGYTNSCVNEAQRGARGLGDAMRLRAWDLTIERGGRRLFAGLSFEAGEGSALLVTGPNGAGKSSLLRALCGFLPRQAGLCP